MFQSGSLDLLSTNFQVLEKNLSINPGNNMEEDKIVHYILTFSSWAYRTNKGKFNRRKSYRFYFKLSITWQRKASDKRNLPKEIGRFSVFYTI